MDHATRFRHRLIRLGACLCVGWLGLPTAAQTTAVDETASVLMKIQGTAYARPLPGTAGCGIEFLLIGRDPDSGGAVQLLAQMIIEPAAGRPAYRLQATVFEGLYNDRRVQSAPGTVTLAPVNGMVVEQPAYRGQPAQSVAEYAGTFAGSADELRTSMLRDHSLRVAFSKDQASRPVSMILDLNVADLQYVGGKAVRSFHGSAVETMRRCLSAR